MIPTQRLTFIGIFLVSISLTNQIVWQWSRPLAWIGLTFGLGCIIFSIYKNHAKEDFTVPFVVHNAISALTGVYIAFYFLSPTEYESIFAWYKGVYLILLVLSVFGINYYKVKRLSLVWRSFAKTAVQSSFFSVYLILFCTATFTEKLNSTVDSNPAKLIPFSLEKDGNLELSEFYGKLPEVPASEFRPDRNTLLLAAKLPSGDYIRYPYFLVYKDGKILSAFPLLPGLYNAGVYFILKCVGVSLTPPGVYDFSFPESHLEIFKDSLYLEKFSAAVLFAFTSILLLKLISRFVSARTALIVVFIYSFGTTHFSNSSQALWQHGFVELLTIVSMFLLLSKNLSLAKKCISFGATLGIFYFVRPPSIAIACAFGTAFLLELRSAKDTKERIQRLIYFSSGAILSNFIFGILNYSQYGHVLGGYHLMGQGYALVGQPDYFTSSFWDGLPGLLFSPGFGLFVFSPFILLSLTGFYFGKKKIGKIFVPTILASLGYLAIFSRYYIWWGGVSYATRFLTDLMPLFALLTFPIVTRSYKLRALKILFAILAAVSIWAHTSAMYLDGPFKEWQACRRFKIPDTVWNWERIPYTYPFRKYYPLFTGELDVQPSYECQIGKYSGFIKGRYAFQFDSSSVLPGSERIQADSNIYLREGRYCSGVFAGAKENPSGPEEGLEILITQGKKLLLDQKVSPRVIAPDYKPESIEFTVPKTDKIKIAVLKKGKSLLGFAGLRIKKGSCENLLTDRENSRRSSLEFQPADPVSDKKKFVKRELDFIPEKYRD